MSLSEAYSLDLKRNIDAKEADIKYQKGLISNQRNFSCPNVYCGIAVTCANLERPKVKRKVEPYFKSVENHKPDCPFGREEQQTKHRQASENALYENIASGEILLNLAEPTVKKQNSTNEQEFFGKKSSQISVASNKAKEKVAINHTKTMSVLVSAFLNGDNFEITLPMPYQEKICLKDLFIELNNQDLSAFEQNCWRVYYGKAWVNKLPKGDYQVRFDAYLNEPSLEKGRIRPTFFIPNQLIQNSTYHKFNQTIFPL